MPAIKLTTPPKILVTGANGYISAWLVRELLQKGYAVRGTVRSHDKAAHLAELFEPHGDRYETVVVEDIIKAGAFDEAVKDIDAIAHTASPFHLKADDPDELLVPAIQGTVSILQSALAYGTNVRRVVITSSCASVLRVSPEPLIFSERDWNEQSIEEVKARGREATPMAKYRASKTLAERAAWSFVSEHASSIKWDLVVINPPYVFGPPIHAVQTAAALNTSLLDWHTTVLGSSQVPTEKLAAGSSWIDVRDLAAAHVLALERQEAGGERIIVSEGPFIWQEWLEAANRVIAQVNLTPDRLRTGKSIASPKYFTNYDTSKAARLLGLGPSAGDGKEGWYKLRGKDESACDMLADFVRRGWA